MSKVRRAYLMATLEQYSLLLLSVLLMVTMSRLLDPTEIGGAAIGIGVAAIAYSIREFVTSEYLIQRAEIDNTDIRTSLSLLLMASLAVALALIVSSPLIEQFYAHPDLDGFIQVLAIAGLFDAISGLVATLLRRDMKFGSLTRINAIGSAVNAAVTIALALLDFGFMSFAWGQLAASVSRFILSLRSHPLKRSLRPSFRGWGKVLQFGMYKGATTITDRTCEALPQMLLGRLALPAAAGYYNRANLICSLPDRFVLSAVYAVAYPALAERVRTNDDITTPFLRTISYLTVVYWPALIGLAILAYPVVNVALGDQWLAVVPILQLLSLASVFWFATPLTNQVLLALGENRAAFVSLFIGRVSCMVILGAASFFGVIALAASQLIAIPLQMAISLHYARHHVRFEWSALWPVLLQSGAVTLFAIAGPLVVVGLDGFRFEQSLLEAALSAALSFVGWIAGLALLKHPFLAEIRIMYAHFLPPGAAVRNDG